MDGPMPDPSTLDADGDDDVVCSRPVGIAIVTKVLILLVRLAVEYCPRKGKNGALGIPTYLVSSKSTSSSCCKKTCSEH